MKKNRTINGFIQLMIIMFVLLFGSVIAYLCYYTYKEAPGVINSPYNGRQEKFNETYIRGNICAVDGQVLATTKVNSKGEQVREYPFGSLFSHVVGYTNAGSSGLESTANYYLLDSHGTFLDNLYKELTDQRLMGDSVITSLDPGLQKVVYDSMKGYRGACVVMDSATGRILASVSLPDFDPNTIKENYEKIVEDEKNSPLLNRVNKGLYTPGSTFKLVTALAYLEQHPDDYKKFSYDCDGSITVDSKKTACAHGKSHGKVDLEEALTKSCNGAFITMGLDLDLEKYIETAERLQFNQKVSYDLSLKSSRFNLTKDSDIQEIAQTAYGQGNTQITPMENAMIVAAICNGGKMMEPSLIDSIVAENGDLVKLSDPVSYGQVMKEEHAEILKSMMENVVENGTAKVLKSRSYKAGAKTGSAETGGDKETDAWMVAFAPYKDSNIVVSIVLEEAGTGSANAGPIVKNIFDYYAE